MGRWSWGVGVLVCGVGVACSSTGESGDGGGGIPPTGGSDGGGTTAGGTTASNGGQGNPGGAGFGGVGDEASGGNSAVGGATATAGVASGGGGSGAAPRVGSPSCEPLPPAQGDVIDVSPRDDLESVVANAPEGSTLLLADGTYDVSGASFIAFREPGVTLRSASGDPGSVVIDGGYGVGSILNVVADDVTIAEVTLQRCMWHPIHVTGGSDSNTDRTTIYRVVVVDPGQQAIKINASSEGYYADAGTVACSRVTLTDEGRDQVSDCYTGGVDAHLAEGWVVRDNVFEGFWCEQGLSEHAVHFWNSGNGTVVERNRIDDCARGIGFGLGEMGNGTSRDYGGDPCPGASFVGHYGGVIRNNVVFGGRPEMFASELGFDSGIALEQACGTHVVHNTIVALEPPFVSIEYRFGNTDVRIANNLTTHRILERDGGRAELVGNVENASLDELSDAAAGDVSPAAGSSAVDSADPSFATETDFEGNPRDGAPDVGAYELP